MVLKSRLSGLRLATRLSKLHKIPYKSRLIANPGSCTTNEGVNITMKLKTADQPTVRKRQITQAATTHLKQPAPSSSAR